MTALDIAAVAFPSVVGIVAVTIALLEWRGDERLFARVLPAIGIVSFIGAFIAAFFCCALIFGVRM